MTLHYNIKKLVNYIIRAIDLNYILAEAEKENYTISLVRGELLLGAQVSAQGSTREELLLGAQASAQRSTREELCDNIKWSSDKCYLSYNYELSSSIIYRYIHNNHDKIIKLNVSSTGDFYPLDRNMVIYLPNKMDIEKIKLECESMVIF